MNMGVGGASVACPLFQAEDDGSRPISALQLIIKPISVQTAQELNAKWHSRLPKTDFNNLVRTKVLRCFGALYGDKWYAAAIWTNPVARLLNQIEWLELRRLAISNEAPKNSASRMLAVMRRLLHREEPQIKTVISYQDTEVHTGAIYRADGWRPAVINQDGEWNRPNRFREKAQSASPKMRWERAIVLIMLCTTSSLFAQVGIQVQPEAEDVKPNAVHVEMQPGAASVTANGKVETGAVQMNGKVETDAVHGVLNIQTNAFPKPLLTREVSVASDAISVKPGAFTVTTEPNTLHFELTVQPGAVVVHAEGITDAATKPMQEIKQAVLNAGGKAELYLWYAVIAAAAIIGILIIERVWMHFRHKQQLE